VAPESVRLRKQLLTGIERTRAKRQNVDKF